MSAVETRAEYIARTVAAFPPLTDGQVQRIAALLAPAKPAGGPSR